jgi:type IV secretory pathway VirB2 component (pilin)
MTLWLLKLILDASGFVNTAFADAITGTLKNPLSCDNFQCVLQKIIGGLQTFANIIAPLMVLIGGLQLMFAGGNEERIKSGKKTILYAVVGYAIVLLASGLSLIIKDVLGG